MALLTQWTWVWARSRRWSRTGKPGVLQSMGSQSVRHDWATEEQKKTFSKQTEYARLEDTLNYVEDALIKSIYKTKNKNKKNKESTYFGKEEIKLLSFTLNCQHEQSQKTYKMLLELLKSLIRSQDTRSVYTYQLHFCTLTNNWKVKLNKNTYKPSKIYTSFQMMKIKEKHWWKKSNI